MLKPPNFRYVAISLVLFALVGLTTGASLIWAVGTDKAADLIVKLLAVECSILFIFAALVSYLVIQYLIKSGDNLRELLKLVRPLQAAAFTSLQQKSLDDLFSQIEATIQLESIYGFDHVLPPSRGWAASPDLLIQVIDAIRTQKPKLVVELGSGLSTVWIAKALKENGGGKLVSLDHEDFFANKTAEVLAKSGLSEWVDLRVSSLEEQIWPEGSELWYAPSTYQDLTDIDVLLVDGPPKRKGIKTYRWPAMWALDSKLSKNAVVILDDAFRDAELELGQTWAERSNFEFNLPALEKQAVVLKR